MLTKPSRGGSFQPPFAQEGLNGVFYFMESYCSHCGVFDHGQLTKNELRGILLQFSCHIMVCVWSF